jgi:hypothetical protein
LLSGPARGGDALLLEHWPKGGWFEITSDNLMQVAARPPMTRMT